MFFNEKSEYVGFGKPGFKDVSQKREKPPKWPILAYFQGFLDPWPSFLLVSTKARLDLSKV